MCHYCVPLETVCSDGTDADQLAAISIRGAIREAVYKGANQHDSFRSKESIRGGQSCYCCWRGGSCVGDGLRAQAIPF